MSDPMPYRGHCEHCAKSNPFEDGRSDEYPYCDQWGHANDDQVAWPDGKCPACAERKRS